MEDSMIIEMEVDGVLMPVVTAFKRYQNRVDLDEIMDTDGEPLDLTREERDQLKRFVMQRSEGLCKAG